MKKINAKKPKETARHLKCINYFSNKNFGISIECKDCKKVRRTFQYSESHEVPEIWCCSFLTLENGEKGSCDDPEEEHDEPFLDYSPGSVVWAKLNGYPWWPGMVDGDPDTGEFSRRERGSVYYNVTFFEEKPAHAFVAGRFICPFLKPPEVGKVSLKKPRNARYAKAISKAKERADAATKMTIKGRLQNFSFVNLYKGRRPAVSISEECVHEENGSKKLGDSSYLLSKNRTDLGSLATNDDERIKKACSGKENNLVEEGKQNSQNSDVPSSQKNTHNAKFLNNTDFIPENETVFSAMKNKKYRHSTSFNKGLSSAKYQTLFPCAEKITHHLWAEDTNGIKRWGNRKFTPRKVKTSEKATPSISVLENIDSGHESDETVIYQKEDYNKCIHNSVENSIAEGKKNYLLEMPSHEKHITEKISNNLKPLMEAKFSKKVNTPTEKSINSSLLSSEEKLEISNYEKHKTEKISNYLESVIENSFCKKIYNPAEKSIDSSHLSSEEEMIQQRDESISEMLNSVKSGNKVILKKSNIRRFKRKTKRTKYLSSKEFIQNEVLFPFMKNKTSKNSSSINKTLSIAKYQTSLKSAECFTNPIHQKEAKGIKRKSNGKLRSRKQKNLEKPAHCLIKDIIDLGIADSEPKSDETFNTIIVSKEDENKTIQDSEEKFMAEEDENYSPGIFDHRKHKTEKKSNNVLNEKEFGKEKNIPSEKRIDSSHLSPEEEMFKHINDSILIVLEFVENESLDVSEDSGEEKIVKTSNKQESNSKIFESIENERLGEFDKCNHSEREKIVETSNVQQKKKAKQKKSQNSPENIKQSNNKMQNIAKNKTQQTQVPPKTKMPRNISDSTLKIKKQKVSGSNKLTKKFATINSNINVLSKQPNSFNPTTLVRKNIKQKWVQHMKKTLKLKFQNQP